MSNEMVKETFTSHALPQHLPNVCSLAAFAEDESNQSSPHKRTADGGFQEAESRISHDMHLWPAVK